MTATDSPPVEVPKVLGTRMLRREDPSLLTGESRFIADLVVPGALQAALVRSPVAHGRISSIDLAPALEMPGVVAAFTGEDLQGEWAGPMPCAWPVTSDMKNPPHFPLAVGTVNYVGDAVAVVLARTEYQAQDAVGAVVVDYDPLPAVIDLEDALSDRVLVHEELGTNASYTWDLIPDPPAVDKAFAEAAHTVSGRYVQQRLIPSPMEPRGVVVVPQPFGGDFTVYSATQVPHILKVMLAVTTGVPETGLRVVAPAVGGGFGSKLNVYAEEVLALVLARKLRQPIRWIEERSEHATSTIQGRGQIQHIELAADADGRVTAVRVKLVADMGGYLQLITPGIPLLGSFLYGGVYDI
ncbi:MAG: xanthine dehydrogenase family protein molybdopterin-binding subunit, partial [Actinomycetes bacterium]